MCDHVAVRAAHFRREYLTWIAVRHFLSADLLEELARALVSMIARDRPTFDEIFETTLTSGPSVLSTWVAQPRPVTDPLARSLQSLVKSLVWTGDDWAGSDLDRLTHDEAVLLKAVAAAFRTAPIDFGSLGSVGARERFPEPLGRPLEWIASVARATVDPGANDEVCAAVADRVATPLDAIVVKHLGDLCADADRWHLASELYARSAGLRAMGEFG